MLKESQIHELWCLVLHGITHEVHPTEHVEVTAGTIGDFVTDYLAENGRRIEIIRKISVNDSVQLWVCMNKPGELEYRLFATYRLASSPQGWEVATITISTGEVAF